MSDSIQFVDAQEARTELPEDFEPYVKEWFNDTFDELTPPQQYSFDLIHNEENSLISAPTGSGKTLSAFLSILNELFLMGDQDELDDKVYALYISPLRALGNDIQRNLTDPREEIKQTAEEMGYDVPEVRSAVRTGDTSSYERQKMADTPPHILITTPESLGIILNSPKFREKFRDLKYVIVDEIHSLSENKRGSHLSLSLERLQAMCNEEFTRIGISATQAPITEIGKFLVGYEQGSGEGQPRPCNIVDVQASKQMDLQVRSPVNDLIHTDYATVNSRMYDQMHDLIQDHTTTLIFTNTRAATERVVKNLKERFPDEYADDIGAHHSSMSREKRLYVEEALKQGDLKVGVTSTSLELGIDIGYIDLVMQLSSPKGVARAVQRIGRSGHKLHEKAKGRVMVTDRDDALECTVMMRCAKEDKIDRVRIPRNCTDVMAQHIVGMGCNRKWGVDEAFDTITQSYTFHNLEREDYDKTMKYVAGDHAKLEDQHVYGKIWIGEDEEDPDRDEKVFSRRGKMTQVIYMTNIGTIPDESAYKVHTRGNKKYMGTLDEGFLDRLTKGDVFVLGGDTYEFQYARGMKVYVDAVPNKSPTVPSWFSEMLPLSFDLGTRIGTFNRKVVQQLKMGVDKQDIKQWIHQNYYVDENTASSIMSYIFEQHRYVDAVPTDEQMVIEETVDDDGKLNLVFHTIYGRRVNDALCRIFANEMSQRMNTNVGIVVSDHGFVLTLPRRPHDLDTFMDEITELDLRETLKDAIRKTELMKRRFRHVAARALMIIRNYKGDQKSVGTQQMKSHFLLAACEKIDPEFPIIKETYREIMEDHMDIEHAEEIVDGLRNDDITYTHISTDIPSPFAHNLVLQSQSDVIMMEDRKKRLQQLHKQVMDRIGEPVTAEATAE